jgi:hypothetical protein
LIAPFAILPLSIGCFVWCLANAWVLFFAIRRLDLPEKLQNIILLIGLVEMLTAIHNVQFNPMLTGWILLSYVLIEKGNLFWATFFIAAGFLTKIYGIAGIAFFWFSKDKLKFAGYFLFWILVLFCLPMLISSPAFIIESYRNWYQSLVIKNAQNIDLNNYSLMQDISVMGLVSRISRYNDLNNLYILVPAAILYALPFLRVNQYKYASFRIAYLCLAMIGVVIFSSSAESPTFVIAVTAVGIWYVTETGMQKNLKNILLGFVILLTSLSATDLFPPYIREHFIVPYSLKALPCFVTWCVLIWQLLFKDFSNARFPKVYPA